MPTAVRAAVTRSKSPSRPRLTKELREFCDRKEITPFLPALWDMVRRHFPTATNQRLELGCDPESGEEWLAIHIDVRGDAGDVMRSYDSFLDDQVRRIPSPQLGLVRLAHWYKGA